jgi:hypothetical protein
MATQRWVAISRLRAHLSRGGSPWQPTTATTANRARLARAGTATAAAHAPAMIATGRPTAVPAVISVDLRRRPAAHAARAATVHVDRQVTHRTTLPVAARAADRVRRRGALGRVESVRLAESVPRVRRETASDALVRTESVVRGAMVPAGPPVAASDAPGVKGSAPEHPVPPDALRATARAGRTGPGRMIVAEAVTTGLVAAPRLRGRGTIVARRVPSQPATTVAPASPSRSFPRRSRRTTWRRRHATS